MLECPNCWEPFPVTVPTTEGDMEIVEDCPVCCRPALVRLRCRPGQIVSAEISAA